MKRVERQSGFRSPKRAKSVLAFSAAFAAVSVCALADDGTTYVFTTGSPNALTNEQLAAIGTKYGNGQITIIGTTSGGQTINGTPVLVGGTGSVTSFNIAGDLNLSGTDAIVAWGSNPISLTVAANANIASGTKIVADAIGNYAGAGGGAGGAAGVRPDVGRGTTPGTGGLNSAAATRTAPEANGSDGGNGTAATLQYTTALNSYAGSAGTTGVNSGVPIGAAGGAGQMKVPLGTPLLMPTFGKGGQGGPAGDPNGISGGGGFSGESGDNGILGQAGAGGLSGIGGLGASILHGGGGGGGGSSGADGIAGGGGGQGGSGGGGKRGPISPLDPNQTQPYGGAAQAGASGTRGGMGANGGAGGNGGGGIGITVGGRLTIDGQVSANGGNGANAAFDLFEQAATSVTPIGTPEPGGVGVFGHGGAAGQAGAGGVGGKGGLGAGGAGGAGGSVFIVASSYYQNNASALVAKGGAGGNTGDEYTIKSPLETPFPIPDEYHAPTAVSPSGADGDIRVNTLGGSTIVRNITIAAPGTVNPFRSYTAATNNNGATTPNLYSSVEGGVAAYGRVTNADGSFNTAGPTFLRTIYGNSIPANTKAVIWQGSADAAYDANYNALAYTAMDSAVDKPGFKLFRNVNPHIDLYIPSPNNPPTIDPLPVASQLLSSGWQRDPRFVAGATGDKVIDTLGNGETYFTLAEKPLSGTYNLIVGQFAPYAKVRTYYMYYTASNPAPPLYLRDTGLANYFVSLSGNGSTKSFTGIDGETRDATGTHFAYRAGSGNKGFSVLVANSGHAGTLMSGQLKLGDASNTFRNLPVSQNGSNLSQLATTFNSTLAAGESETRHLELTSDAGNVTGDLTIDVVGPALSITGGNGGTFPQGAHGGLFVDLRNNSTYTAIPSLSDLDILGASVLDNPSGLFSVADGLTDTVSAGEFHRLTITFSGTSTPGVYTALLRLLTDQNADYMKSGQTFDVGLQITVVPEPSTLALLGFGGTLLLRRRRQS